ncbi:hypothetical protein C1865_05690 [Eggerthella lenta]|nr:hypothetical protein C1865_05690 [Eggerthella lenta]RDC10900.1 hypothetical protein C1860_13090 [Eggerthella lenta]RDC31484.1 hypothetical protein C1855_01640 [Eggerthella lenta]
MLAALEVFRVSKQIVYQKFDDHQRQISKIFLRTFLKSGVARYGHFQYYISSPMRTWLSW